MKQVLITGAANGLGRSTTLKFQQEGWTVIATDIDQQSLDTLTGVERVRTFRMDVTSEDSVQHVRNEVQPVCNSIDLIINNAGIDRYFPFSEASPGQFKEVFEVNLFGAYRVNHYFLPLLKSPGGRIIHIGSESVHLTLPFMPYPLTKRALESYAKGLRQELIYRGIDVVVIRHGAIQTRIVDNLSDIPDPWDSVGSNEEASVLLTGRQEGNRKLRSAFQRFTSFVPHEVGKVVSPENVANFIYEVSQIRHPRSLYRINNSIKLKIASLLPFGWIEKAVLKKLS